MRAILLLFLVAACTMRPLTDEEVSITDDQCPQELYLAGLCEQAPLVRDSITE